MKVVLVVAGRAGENCGVHDYTTKLSAALAQALAPGEERRSDDLVGEVVMEAFPEWKLDELLRIKREHGDAALLHLQYPSMGIGASVSPLVLPTLPRGKCVVTLHEFSVFNPVRKAAFLAWALFGSAFIFSNDYEREQFLGLFPFARSRCHVIPIGTNIGGAADGDELPWGTNRQGVVFFGQISPGKGVEEFLKVAREFRKQHPEVPLSMIGRLMNPESPFATEVTRACADYDIELLDSLPASVVAQRLQRAKVAVLPYPDGISDKRGSALACLHHGVTVVTVHSEKTSGWLRSATYGVTSVSDTVACVSALLAGERPLNPSAQLLRAAMRQRSWPSIAARHRDLYASLLFD